MLEKESVVVLSIYFFYTCEYIFILFFISQFSLVPGIQSNVFFSHAFFEANPSTDHCIFTLLILSQDLFKHKGYHFFLINPVFYFFSPTTQPLHIDKVNMVQHSGYIFNFIFFRFGIACYQIYTTWNVCYI